MTITNETRTQYPASETPQNRCETTSAEPTTVGPIRIHACDFGRTDAWEMVRRILPEEIPVELDQHNPEVVFYSVFSSNFLDYPDAVRIFYTGENVRPDFNLTDYAISFDYLYFGDRHLRMPNFAFLEEWDEIKHRRQTEAQRELLERKFCNFIYSNPNAHPARDDFFHKLNSIEPVDSLGPHLRNTDTLIGARHSESWRQSKLEVQSNYKFSIAFENSPSPGYTTEKIVHALASDTIPIYWGDPQVTRVFNPNRFIDVGTLGVEKALEKVIELHKCDGAYLDMLHQPFFAEDADIEYFSRSTAKAYITSIFARTTDDRYRRNRWMWGDKYEKRRQSERDALQNISRKGFKRRAISSAKRKAARLIRK